MTKPAEPEQYLSFQLGADVFACNILQVKEILEYHRLTGVPQMPAFVHGVMNLRGTVVPVIDLAQRCGRPASAILRRSCIVILEAGHEGQRQFIGMLVDAVHEVISLSAADILPAPAFGNHLRPDFIAGVTHRQHGFIMLLHMDKVLSIEEMAGLSSPLGVQIKAESACLMN
ncbi:MULTISPECIES: chemotaxis protein CheW [Aquitalea]|uniref:chemotaxis protein CheW n=1 Tax=Aquitalea TaxID=407217 RepID=UPI001F3F0E35|nr:MULTISPECIES: chemotaxis protein CheW [Aquitalea]